MQLRHPSANPRHAHPVIATVTVLALVALSLLPPSPARASGVVYVKPAGTGDGSSWALAADLAAALSAAQSGDELWVAAGTYRPGASRSDSFLLKPGVAAYGGFAGTETARDQRDWLARPSILSGDLGVPGNKADNSCTVVKSAARAGPSTILDGFTITGGNANDPGLWCEIYGGGMLNELSSPTLTNLTFSDNTASSGGGGMANISASSLTLTNVRFIGNRAESGGGLFSMSSFPVLTRVTFSGNHAGIGGGLYSDGSRVTLAEATFSGNSADLYGGGMYSGSSLLSLTDATFSANSAGLVGGGGMFNLNSQGLLRRVSFSGNTGPSGGGIYNANGSSPSLREVTLTGNTATDGYGGGIYNNVLLELRLRLPSSPTLVDVTISGNRAIAGGGMANANGSSPTLVGVTISGNAALSGGGLYNVGGSSPSLANVIISGNTAEASPYDGSGGDGGGVANDASSPTLSNVTISGNLAVRGAGVANLAGSGPQIRNSIIWGNRGPLEPAIFNAASAPTVRASLFQGELPAGVVDGGANLLWSDPQFVTTVTANPGAPSAGGDLRLRPGSPALDKGDAALLPADGADLDGDGVTAEPLPLDRLGAPRVSAGGVDLGAYELQVPALLAISRAGASPTSAAALDFAVSFDMPVTGVDASDFALITNDGQAGAQISAVSGGGSSYLVRVATVPDATGLISLELRDNDTISASAGVPLGGAGLGNGGGSGEAYSVDRVAPTVALAGDSPSPTSASPLTVTVSFSKSVSGFGSDDIEVANATVGELSGGGATYQFTLTPLAQGAVTATVAAGAALDAAGNPSLAASTLRWTYDSQRPLALSIAAPDLRSAGAPDYLFTVVFSDNIGLEPASLRPDAVAVTGPRDYAHAAELVSVVASPDGTLTATYRIIAPGGSWSSDDNGAYAIAVAESAVVDRAGNRATAAAPQRFAVAVAVTVTVVSTVYLPAIQR